jgi:MFS family permease
VTLSAVMGVSSITPAFPQMAKELNISKEQIGWLITAFTIPGIFLTPVLGILADQFGRKKILIPSLILFSAAGTACAFTTDFSWLIGFRFLQGMGGAALGTLNVTLIGDLYEGNRRSTAMGYNGSVLSVGTASYPAIGGALALIGWNIPFLLPILVLPVALFAFLKLDNPEPENGVDLRSYLAKVIKSLKSKSVVVLFLANFLTFVLLYGGILTYFPILLDEFFGFNSFYIGLYLTVSSIFTAIISSRLGKLSEIISQPNLIKIAAFGYVIVFVGISFIHHPLWLLVPIVIYGASQGINIPSILNLLTTKAPMEQRAAFLSVNWMILRSGQTAGPLVLGLFYSAGGTLSPFYAGIGISLLLLLMVTLFLDE